MDTSTLLGVWTGTAHNSSGWDMRITISIFQPFDIGSTLGVFDIPLIPCFGSFRVTNIRGQTIELRPENLRGECVESDSDSLELLADGTLLYRSKGKGWETEGILQRANEDTFV
ncbi:MAG TPA: hypothetical protein VJ821_03810 [Anaerolineales bacterium]|nr:hypothetical protein [Anaerolineales bacterium]